MNTDASKGYRDLTVWDRSMELSVEVYRLARELPDSERFGLVSQLQRSAISIPSNIAEGRGRIHSGDFMKHLSYARGSLAEVETQLELAVRIAHLDRDHVRHAWSLCQEVGKMLTSLIKTVSSKS